MNTNRPKIGLALSGGAGRAIGHVAVLEVLQENKIPIDIIVGCSSGALIAAAYGAGTLEFLKNFILDFTFRGLWTYWTFWGARGGLFHIHKTDPILQRITRGLNFEDLPIKTGFTASDIQTGELVTISSGDLIPALKATVAVPGLLEPVVINDRILLDGGLVNVLPTLPVKQMGADIVIGVDVAIAKFFYQRKNTIWRIIRASRRMLGLNHKEYETINSSNSKILDTIKKQIGIKTKKVPNALRIFFWAGDHSFDVEKEWSEEQRACDFLIEPEVKEFGQLGISKSRQIYEEVRKEAQEAVPKIKELIEKFEHAKVR